MPHRRKEGNTIMGNYECPSAAGVHSEESTVRAKGPARDARGEPQSRYRPGATSRPVRRRAPVWSHQTPRGIGHGGVYTTVAESARDGTAWRTIKTLSTSGRDYQRWRIRSRAQQ